MIKDYLAGSAGGILDIGNTLSGIGGLGLTILNDAPGLDKILPSDEKIHKSTRAIEGYINTAKDYVDKGINYLPGKDVDRNSTAYAFGEWLDPLTIGSLGAGAFAKVGAKAAGKKGISKALNAISKADDIVDLGTRFFSKGPEKVISTIGKGLSKIPGISNRLRKSSPLLKKGLNVAGSIGNQFYSRQLVHSLGKDFVNQDDIFQREKSREYFNKGYNFEDTVNRVYNDMGSYKFNPYMHTVKRIVNPFSF